MNPVPLRSGDLPEGRPDYTDAVAKDGSLVVTVGHPDSGREKRRVNLLGVK